MKTILPAGALLLCSALAQAAPVHWTFSYTGFYDREAGQFLPDMMLSGAFSGEDADGDGVLERPELHSLLVGDTDYVACAAGSNAYYYCGADRFTFSPSGGLSFSLGAYGSDPEGYVGGGHLIESGGMDYEYRFSPGGNAERHLLWTDATVLVMTPVPEAGAWTMLAAGLCVVGAFMHRARLRRRIRSAHGYLYRHLRLALPAVARRVLSARPGPGARAGLRGARGADH